MQDVPLSTCGGIHWTESDARASDERRKKAPWSQIAKKENMEGKIGKKKRKRDKKNKQPSTQTEHQSRCQFLNVHHRHHRFYPLSKGKDNL